MPIPYNQIKILLIHPPPPHPPGQVLSPRESVIEQNRQARRQIIAEANNRISIHPVLEIPPRFTHNQRSPQPVTRRAANRVVDAPEDDTIDVDRISLLADADSSSDAPIVIVRHASSPYAQRRHGSGAATPVATGMPPVADIQIVDDHYSGGRLHSRRIQPDQSSGSASENSSTAFTMID